MRKEPVQPTERQGFKSQGFKEPFQPTEIQRSEQPWAWRGADARGAG
jgi:hypothetical protein